MLFGRLKEQILHEIIAKIAIDCPRHDRLGGAGNFLVTLDIARECPSEDSRYGEENTKSIWVST
jgi:hypothetical protein